MAARKGANKGASNGSAELISFVADALKAKAAGAYEE
jgi:hypothetical protein